MPTPPLFPNESQNPSSSEDRFRIALNAAPNGMIMVDQYGAIVMANRKMEEIFAYRQDEMIGLKIETLVPRHIATKHVEYRESFLKDPIERPMGAGRDLYGIRKDGSSVPLEIGLTPIKTDVGTFVVASVIDITERKLGLERLKEQEQLKKENYALSIASRFKSQFISNASHEIRNPLNCLVLLTQSLLSNQEGNLTASQLESLRVIESSAQDLLFLVNDLLDHSKIEKGMIQISPEEVQIQDILKKIDLVYAPEAHEKNITFTMHSHLADNEAIYTDRYRLEQILRNIIGNAFKFLSPGGKIDICFEAEEKENQKYLVVRVKDSGPGISSADLDIVFDRFKQVAKNENSEIGAGLGLAISKQLVSLLQGEIEVSSAIGKGSTFVVRIPFLKKDDESDFCVSEIQETKPLSVTEQERARLRGLRVLIVDDDLRNIFALRRILLDLDMYVEHALSASQALEKIRKEETFAVIFMDIMIPEMDGCETMRQLRAENLVSTSQVIGMSGHFSTTQSDYESIGFFSFLSKPIDSSQMIRLILEALSKHP